MSCPQSLVRAMSAASSMSLFPAAKSTFMRSPMQKKIKLASAFFLMFSFLQPLKAEDKKPLKPKEQCAQLKKQIESLQKEKTKVEASLKPIEEQRDKAK